MKDNIRILFTSAGRRVELVQAFQAAARRLKLRLFIYGSDVTDTAPALQFCDRTVLTPKITDSEYIPSLLSLCAQERIDALIPTIDTDLLLLAEHRGQFEAAGTRVAVSDRDKVALCRDKRFTAEYFASVGLRSPCPVDDIAHYDGGFPAFIKPRDGSSGVDAYQVHDQRELLEYSRRVPNYIVQPYVSGTEYTVDVFCDFEGNPIYITPRVRLAVRAGEVLKTEVRQDEQIIAEMERLVSHYRPRGAITVQLIRDAATGLDWYIEINPRFGGGAPLSMKAGADGAEAMLRLLRGERLDYRPNAAEDGARYSRFDQSVRVLPRSGREQLELGRMKAVLFDLDDTLYAEKEYVRSGYRTVAALLPQVPDVEQKLWRAFERGLPAIDTVLKDEGVDDENLRLACVEAYRGHTPEIHLYPGAADLLAGLRRRGIKTGVITDGRPEGQRAKLAALGIPGLVDETIVTDELGGPQFRKPDDISFRVMQRRLNVSFESMVYIGDNPQKDFRAPESLGMQTVYVRNPDGLYSAGAAGDRLTVRNLEELRAVLL